MLDAFVNLRQAGSRDEVHREALEQLRGHQAAAATETDKRAAAAVTAAKFAGPKVGCGADGQASWADAIFRPQHSCRECGPTGKGSDH